MANRPVDDDVISMPVEGIKKYNPKPKVIMGLFKGKDNTGSPSKIDESLSAIKQKCKERAAKLVDATSFDASKPVLLLGPSLETFNDSPLLAKAFKDGRLRYTNYSFNAFYFGELSFVHYGCDISCLTHQVVSETAEEIAYADVLSVGVYTRVIDNPVKAAGLSHPQIGITEFCAGTAARSCCALFRIPTLEDFHKQPADARQEENCARLISTLMRKKKAL